MNDKFPTESNFQGDLLKEFFPLISLFQLSMHLNLFHLTMHLITLHQISAGNTHVADNIH